MAKKSKPTAGLPQLISLAMDAKPPSDKQRVKDHARNAKVRATQDWVDGRIDSREHENVHKRADHILTGKPTTAFRGKTGEKKSW